jgi:hypothetical protein
MAHEPPLPPAPTCPWCSYMAEILKSVLLHMESWHAHAWLDVILYPPIAGGIY